MAATAPGPGPGVPRAGHEAAVAAFRDLLQDARKTLEDRFHAGVPASSLVRQRARFVDEVVIAAWRRVGLDAHPELALVAVGGYGRSELHPGSDIDLLVLLPRSGGAELADGLRALVAFLWDVGLEVGHSARSVQDCVREAAREVTVATALMEARLLAGSESLFASMREATGPDRVWPSREFYLGPRTGSRASHQLTSYQLATSRPKTAEAQTRAQLGRCRLRGVGSTKNAARRRRRNRTGRDAEI